MALFTSSIFVEGILPFLLVFVLVFAILQKTKILGEGKTQIDALIALAIGLISVAVPTTRDFIVNMMPWLAFALVVLLVFLLVYGFVATANDPSKGLNIPDWVKTTVLILGIIMVVVLAIYVTGFWPTVKSWFSGDDVLSTVLLIIVIAVVVGMVAKPASESGKDKAPKSG
jgi:peptidoglycan/LPS O-acetylase OafA/YrhL